MQRKWKRKWRKAVKFTAPLAAGVLLWLSVSAYANPSGASVASGAVSVVSQGAVMTVNQQSSKAIVNWQSFNIAQGESVRFVQPSASAVALNRIVGSEASSIYGSLSANGKIFLVNPNGIYFRPGSQVSVGGLVASSLNISDRDFLSGNYVFKNTGSSGSASVINSGTIQAGKEAVLIGSTAANEGLIAAKVTALGAGGQVSLSFTNDDLVSLTVDTKALDAKVTNRGTITADGGVVVMSAGTKDALIHTVVNNSGVIQAKSVGEKQGTIYFSGDEVINSGTITARGESGQTIGGTVTLTGGTIRLENESVVDVSGQGGGGTAVIGNWQAETATAKENSVIRADSLRAGNGGSVSFIGRTASAGGTISVVGQGSGNGGEVETSGEKLDISGGKVNVAGGRQGKGGSWLLDPYDMTIDASGASAISSALGSGGNVKVQTGTAGSSVSNGITGLSTSTSGTDGNINVNSAISWAGSGGTLTLDAYHSINVNANVNITGSGTNAGVNLITNDTAGSGTSASGSGKLTFSGGSLTFSGTNSNLTINGQGYTIVNSLGAIGASGHYALGTDVDDSGRGGTVQTSFSGALEGLGHTLSNLTISSAGGTNVGLFGTIASGGSVSNLTIKDANVTGGIHVGVVAGINSGTLYHVGVNGGSVSGGYAVGGLVSENFGSISNSYNSGSVSGGSYVGGLVGYNGGSISNSYNSGSVSGGSYVGGLVGYNNTSGSISNSYNSGSVSGWTEVGGLVGYNNTSGSISNSYNSGSVSGGSYVGGLVSENFGSISNSYNSGSVSGGSYVGGLVGVNNYDADINVSYNSGSVSGGSYVGGLVGINGGSVSLSYNSGSVSGGSYVGGLIGVVNSGRISASYNSGSVSGGSYVGGLVGALNGGSISNNYNSGSVSGGSYVGGLVGVGINGGSISNSYWNSDLNTISVGSNAGISSGATGLTTSEMTSGTLSYGTAFDFTNTWYQSGSVNSGYPILRSSPFVVTVRANVGSTITYGDLPSVNYSYSNLWAGDTAESLGMASQISLSGGSTSSSGYLNAGTQTLSPVVTGSYTSANGGTKAYTIIQESGTVVVNPKPINYTVANASGTYGSATAGSVTLSGTISGDSVVGTVGVQNNTGGTVSSLTTATPVGTYTERVTGLSNANYTIAASGNTNGTLTIIAPPPPPLTPDSGDVNVVNPTPPTTNGSGGSVTSVIPAPLPVTPTPGGSSGTGGTVGSLGTVMAAIEQLVGALQQGGQAGAQMGMNGGSIRSLRSEEARNFAIEGSGINRDFTQQLQPAELRLLADYSSSRPSISQSVSQSGGQVASLTRSTVTAKLEAKEIVVTMSLSGETLSSEVKTALDQILAVSRERPAAVFSVSASEALSGSSKQAVLEYLTSRGLDSTRMQLVATDTAQAEGNGEILRIRWSEAG